MADFEIDLSGMAELQDTIDDLKDDYGESPVYVVGTNVEYGVYLEFGTRDMPPYAWFRPAIREFKANPTTFILENTGWNSIDEIPSTKELVRAVANALENQMKDNVNAQDANGRSPGTHPDHPKRQSGNLTADIEAERIG